MTRGGADNAAYIALALYELGGAGRFIDVEDIFGQAYELAPQRFGWRTRELPNYKTLYKALRDFEATHPEGMIKTRDGLARQLTAAGVELVEAHRGRRRPMPARTVAARHDLRRVLSPVLSSNPFREYLEGRPRGVMLQELSEMLVTAPDSSAEAWRERLETYRSAARRAQRPDVLQFLDYLETLYPERFGGRA